VTSGEKGAGTGAISVKTIAILVLCILFVIFLVQNSEVVSIRFLFMEVTMSRVLLLLGSLVVGGLIGFLAGWEVFSRRR
jgi:uncharacterized integral membrane protein